MGLLLDLNNEATTGERPKAVRVWLLGGFRVSVGSRIIEDKMATEEGSHP